MTTPTVADFKAKFVRDFPYGADASVVMDADITSALADAGMMVNPDLFATQATYANGYLLLAAHYLVTALRSSSQGVAGQYSFLVSSKSAGNVSESSTIPQKMIDHPVLAMLCKTTYGARYVEFVLPLLVGPVATVEGWTSA